MPTNNKTIRDLKMNDIDKKTPNEKSSFVKKILSRKNTDNQEPLGFQKEKEKAKDYLDDKKKLKGLNAAVAQKVEGVKNQFREGVGDLYTLMRLVAAYAQGEYRQVSKKTMIAVVAALLYFLSPIDLIPDVLVFIGYIDDLSVLAYVMRTFKQEIDRFVAWEMDGGDVQDELK